MPGYSDFIRFIDELITGMCSMASTIDDNAKRLEHKTGDPATNIAAILEAAEFFVAGINDFASLFTGTDLVSFIDGMRIAVQDIIEMTTGDVKINEEFHESMSDALDKLCTHIEKFDEYYDHPADEF